MQQALLFAQSVRALQRAKAWSPDVCRRIMQWHGAHSSVSTSASRSTGRTHSPFASGASAQGLSSSAIDEQQQAEAPRPAIPLCERPAEHTAPLADLLAWREAAEQQVAAVGTSWEQQDDGPSMEDLQVGAGLAGAQRGALRLPPAWQHRCSPAATGASLTEHTLHLPHAD